MSGQHARLSPSGSKGWMACAGRIVLEAAFPDHGNEHSDAGTAMHDVASKVLTSVAGVTADDYIGHHVKVSDEHEELREVEITEEMAQIVQDYVDEVRVLAVGGDLHVEQRVEFSEFVGVEDQFGTADVIILQPATALPPVLEGGALESCTRMVVGDLKTGYHYVPVEENSQLMLYALGAYRQYELAYDIREIELIIFQPNNGGTRSWSCSVSDLMVFAGKAHDAAQRVEWATQSATNGMPQAEWEAEFLHPSPNEIDCAYCRAMSTCPAKQRKLEEVVGGSFELVIEPVDHSDEPLPLTAVDMMTVPVDKLARAMDAAGEFEDWIKAVRAEVERRLLLGQDVPGWGLELGREGARAWTDLEAAEHYLRKTLRLPIEKAYDLKLISPTSAERLAGFKQGKKIAKPKEPPTIGEKQWKKLQPMIKRSPPSPSVKPTSVIKIPYLPQQPNADAFDIEEEDLT